MLGGFRSLLPQLGFWPGGGGVEGRVLPHGRALHALGSNSPRCGMAHFAAYQDRRGAGRGVYPSGRRTKATSRGAFKHFTPHLVTVTSLVAKNSVQPRLPLGR
jgi:hypothetical protein